MTLCDSDYRFMTIVWDNAPIGSGELAKLCNDILGWKKSTTYTQIKKLCQKGYIKNENAVVYVLIDKEKVLTSQSDEFVEKTFNGSLPMFLTAFLEGKKLSEKEAEKLKGLIDSYKEE